jgi:hypothetical protein
LASAPPILSLNSVEGHVEIDFMPQLDDYPEMKASLLRGCARADLYLIAVASFNDLILRRDLRRAALREFASQANWGTWGLRWTALRTRFALYVFGDALTERGSSEAEEAVERLRDLVAQMQTG